MGREERGEDSQKHFDSVCQLLTDLSIDYQLNSRLVRGLDYYTHTAFEIQSDDLGAQATVCGGGRYDGLINQLGGAETPAIGWAMGMERLILLLEKLEKVKPNSPDIYFVSRGKLAEAKALVIAQNLRQNDFTVELDLTGSKFDKQFKRADRSGAKACLVLGDSEVEENTIQLKWLAIGEQITLKQEDLIKVLEGE